MSSRSVALHAAHPPARRLRCLACVATAGVPAVQRSWHTTRDGARLEVLSALASPSGRLTPPLLFVHGSFHGAWCWHEHWLRFFQSLGFDCHALSLRGHGQSDAPAHDEVAGTLSSHAADVLSFARTLPSSPVLVGHSFGGLCVQEAISSRAAITPLVAGAALLCSVPPAGNSAMALRMLFSTPLRAARVTYAMVSRAFEQDAALCRATFFSESLGEEQLVRYQAQMAGSGKTQLLDLRTLNASLPVPPPPPGLPVLVLGAESDAVVDREGVEETSRWVKTKAVWVPGAHDIMLDADWHSAAEALRGWLNTVNTIP